MTTLAIRNSPGYGMRGSHPNGDFSAPGQAIISDINVPPESLLYGQTIEVGDPITYTVSAIKSGGGSGTLSIDSLGVPSIAGAYGTYGITATWTNQTTGIPVALYGILPHTDEAAVEQNFNYLPLDANGWSIITPSADSRLIYVDSTDGSDVTGTHYLPSTLPNVNNWNDPGAVLPYATLEAALGDKRQDFPDWILLKRGEEFTFSGNQGLKNGRSLTERSVITAYGPGTARPHINPADSGSQLRYWGSSSAFFGVIKEVLIYPTWADPDHVDFDPINGLGNRPSGITIYNGADGGEGVIVEDCHIKFCNHNIRCYGDTDSATSNSDIILRRNILEYSDAQGIYASEGSVIVEENFFNHCGWWTQTGIGDADGWATIFDHTFYGPSLHNSIIRNNISVAPSSIHFKLTANTDVVDTIKAWDVILYNNFMIEGEVALSLGGNDDQNTGARWRDIRSAHNVATRVGVTEPTDRGLGWGEDCQDWEGGMVGQNLYFNYGSANVPNVAGLALLGHCSDVVISDLIVYDIGAPSGTNENSTQGMSTVAHSGTMTNCHFVRPIIQLPNTDCRVVGKHEALTGVTFTDGKYHSAAAANDQFEYNGAAMNHADWVTNTGDTGVLEQVTFVDPNKTIETYMTSIGETATQQAFIDACRNRQGGAWDTNYDARYINPYFRSGFREAA